MMPFNKLLFSYNKSEFTIFTALILPSEAVVQRSSVKKMFLKVSQNSQENTCARVSFLIKLQASATAIKLNIAGEHIT